MVFALAVAGAAGSGASAVEVSVPVRASLPPASIPPTLTLNVPGRIQPIAPDATELVPPVPYTAKIVARIKTYVVTALCDGRPYRVMVVVVDSTGLTYSASQQGGRAVKDPESDDALRVRVTSLSPVVFDVSTTKADAHATATRERVAVDDLPPNHAAFALKENHLAVEVRRLDDEIELR
jgi:hypothetical protein